MFNSSLSSEVDSRKLTRLHYKMIFTAGMGFFTDAYDLFIIGVVTTLLTPIWHLAIWQLALLNGAALCAAGGGAILFGYLSDRFGRKKMYGIEILILFIGAILSAIAPNYYFLLFARVLVGFGIGGDYPSSAVVTSEHANQHNRGFLVLLVFAMQALGLLVGPFLACLFLALKIPHEITCRLLLGLGAIPAASVYYLRRNITETPRYLLNQELPFPASYAMNVLNSEEIKPVRVKKSLMDKRILKYLIGTAGAWFLLDVAFYGNGISLSFIMHTLDVKGRLLEHTLLSTLMFLIFAVPGYILAAKYVDIIGRKFLQILGFTMMAICYALVAIPLIQDKMILFVLVFGLSFFFVNFGPNTTTFLIPSEIYPTEIRARAHGLSAAIGKVGAFVGAFALPLFLHSFGLSLTMLTLSGIALLGIVVTRFLPEMKGVSLE